MSFYYEKHNLQALTVLTWQLCVTEKSENHLRKVSGESKVSNDAKPS